jgi:hypothetical protein
MNMDAFKHRHLFGFGCALILLLWRPQEISAQSAVQRLTLRGVVIAAASDLPLPRATVAIEKLNVRTVTDSRGQFAFPDLSPGTYSLSVRLLGYEPQTVNVVLSAADSIHRVYLRQLATLDTMVVRDTRSTIPGFDERRAMGIGHFLTRDDLAKHENRRTGDILAQVPGIRVYRGKGYAWIGSGRGASTLQPPPLDRSDLDRGARPQCYANVYLDGAIVYTATPFAPLFDVNSISPANIEAIEFYSGGAQIPARYNRTNAQCGVLLIWTRH